MGGQMGLPFPQGRIGQQTDIYRPCHRVSGMRAIGGGRIMQIDFLLAKTQGKPLCPAASWRKARKRHPQNITVKMNSFVDITSAQHQMINSGNMRGHGTHSEPNILLLLVCNVIILFQSLELF
jgi:hypothetical protein